MEIEDLTYVLDEKTLVYPGDEKADVRFLATVDKQGYAITKLSSNMHIGTHIEVPSHMLKNTKRICEYDIDRFFLDASFYGKGYKDAVIVEKKIANDEYDYLTLEEATDLINHNVKMVILNTPSPDCYPYDIHKLLFSKDIMIVENAINLSLIRDWTNFKIAAFPLKLKSEASLIRLVAIKE